jgi:hypothetical protein
MYRRLIRRIAEVEGREASIKEKVLARVEDVTETIKRKILWHEIGYFFKNLPHFVKQAWEWRDFDSSYTIEALCKNLDKLGDGLARYNNSSESMRYSRRAKIAAAQLRKSNEGHFALYDKAYMNWSNNNKPFFEDEENSNLLRMSYKRKYPEDYSEKMWAIIHKRVTKEEEEYKKFAWAYFIKHYQRMWD